jgi:hypothetical protein
MADRADLAVLIRELSLMTSGARQVVDLAGQFKSRRIVVTPVTEQTR